MEIIVAVGLGAILLLPRRTRSFTDGVLKGLGWSALLWIFLAWAILGAQSLPAVAILLLASCVGALNVRGR